MTDRIRLGSLDLDGTVGIIPLYAKITNAPGEQRISTLHKCGTSNSYQVPTGKILELGLLLFQANLADVYFNLLYGDDNVGFNSAMLPGNAVYLTSFQHNDPSPIHETNQYVPHHTDLYFEIPAGKWPAFEVNVGGCTAVVLAWGVER